MESRSSASTGTCSNSRSTRGVQTLVRDLNRLYREMPALHRARLRAAGFEWLVIDDAEHSVFAWLRKGRDPSERCVVVVNFTPQVCRDYRVRVPFAGAWREVLNTDAADLWRQQCRQRRRSVTTVARRRRPELSLVLPPLAALFLVPERLSMRVSAGSPHPLGATWDGRGTNFALFSANAEKVELCLFDSAGPARARAHRAAGADRRRLARLSARRAAGPALRLSRARPLRARAGHRFNPNKLLLDPYAKRLGRPAASGAMRISAIAPAARAPTCRSTGATMRAACRSRW